jgi:hypothetical protein
LITVSERVLAGDRLYVDVFELNPPASVLLLLPAVALANSLDLRAEMVLAASVIALAVGSSALTVRILGRSGLLAARQALWLMPLFLTATLLLVGYNFAQREHIAMLACLPWLALMAVRAEALPVSGTAPIWAGLGAGVTAMVKPHFVLVVALPLLAACWRRRSLGPLLAAEVWPCVATLILYMLATLILTPEFLTIAVPLVLDGYLQQRHPLLAVLTSVPTLLAVLVLAALGLVCRQASSRTPPLMLALGAAAFQVAVVVQSKGFSNHQYPVLALLLIALGLALAGRTAPSREGRLAFILLVCVTALGTLLAGRMHLYPQVAEIIRREAPARPSLIMAGTNLTIAHPLTRWVDGTWAGRRASLWATFAAGEALSESRDPSHRARLLAQMDEDRRIWLDDVQRKRPDVVLVPQGEGTRWIASHPDVQQALLPYREAGAAQGVAVMVRH